MCSLTRFKHVVSYYTYYTARRPLPPCLRLGNFLLPLLGFRLLLVLFFGGTCLMYYLFSFFSSFFCFSFLFSFNASGLLAGCVRCACHIQYGGMTLHCLLPLLHHDQVSLSYRLVRVKRRKIIPRPKSTPFFRVRP